MLYLILDEASFCKRDRWALAQLTVILGFLHTPYTIFFIAVIYTGFLLLNEISSEISSS